MADTDATSLCEEPDDDFFDTFFDDGVLETIGEVLAEQRSDGDSSCDSIKEISSTNVAPNSGNHALLPNNSTEESHQKNDKIIILKPANIHDPEEHSKHKSSNNKPGSCSVHSDSSSATASYGMVQRNALKQLSYIHSNKSSSVVTPASSKNEISSHDKEAKEKNGPETKHSLSMEELLAKVSKILNGTPGSKDLSKDESAKSTKPDNVQTNELRGTIDSLTTVAIDKANSNQEDTNKKKSNESLSREPSPRPISSSVEKDVNSGTVTEVEIFEQEEGELNEDSVSSSCILSTSNGCVTVPKNTGANMKLLKSKDEAEKENDLTLEKTFHKNSNFQSPSEKKNKIPINLKSQLLASTTIISSSSAINSNTSSTKQKKKRKSSLSSKDIYSSISSLSDDSGPSRQSQKGKKKKRKKSTSSDLESSDSGRHKHKSDGGRRRSRKRSKRDDSPRSRRRKDSKRSKNRRSRSRSSSPYSSYRRKVSQKRSRYNRQYASSRSPDSYRSRKSPSPSSHRRRRSRSRSRSPFINEISRLKKLWEREDEAKRSSSRHSQNSVPLPWSSETTNATSTTIVSNMMSVSGDSVHVQSTSFTSIEAFPQAYQGYMAGLPSGFAPNHYGGPDYTNFNGGSYSGFMPDPLLPTQAPAPSKILLLPQVPGLDTAIPPPLMSDPSVPTQAPTPNEILLLPQVLGLDTAIPPPMIQAVPEDSSNVLALDTSIPPPTSVLRKQLDILKSTVASLPEPCVSPKTAQPIINIPTQVEKDTNKVVELPITLVSTERSSTDSTSGEKNSETTTSADNSAIFEDDLSKKSTATEETISSEKNSGKSKSSEKISKRLQSSEKNSRQSSSAEKSSSKSVSASPVEQNPVIKTRPNLTPISLFPESSQEFALNTPCGQNDPSIRSQPNDEIITIEASNEKEVDALDPNNTVARDSDSDVVIEEPPPKPPVELICLSPDEDDGGNECDGGNTVKNNNSNGNAASGANDCDEDITNLYDLDTELDKIDKDMHSMATVKNCTSSEVYRKKKKKRNRKSSSKKRENAAASTDHETRKKKTQCDEDKKSDDTQNSVIRECQEMIDSLRIGRFVVDDNSGREPVFNQELEGSNSLLKRRPIAEFLYTKKSNIEVISKTRSVSTNTVTQLCIDVCIGTDNTVIQKDAVVQTNIKCSACNEKKCLIEEMKTKILELEREKDELRAKFETQSIPGLGVSSGKVNLNSKKSSGTNIHKTQSRSSSCSNNSLTNRANR